MRCVGTKDPTRDVTDELTECAKAQADWVAKVYGYIFKKDSPSCGMERVKVYNQSSARREGRGIYAAQVMDAVWRHAATPAFARRRIFDTRLALTLRHHGVAEFATANVKDFRDFGFNRVWNPLSEPAR